MLYQIKTLEFRRVGTVWIAKTPFWQYVIQDNFHWWMTASGMLVNYASSYEEAVSYCNIHWIETLSPALHELGE